MMQIPITETQIVIGMGRLWIPVFRPYGSVEIRNQILTDIQSHEGDLFIIDDAFSEMIDESYDEAILDAMEDLGRSGAGVGRYWGCESDCYPYEDWQGFGQEHEEVEFSNVEHAVHKLGCMVKPGRIKIAGAWLGACADTGQINLVHETLRDEFGHQNFEIGHTAFADPLRHLHDPRWIPLERDGALS